MSTVDTFIEEDGFGFVPRPKFLIEGGSHQIIRRYTLTNKNKASVQLISWGASIQSIKIPNNKGILGDVVLGFDDIDGYLKNRYFGSIVGRVTNYIAHGVMRIDNKQYKLSRNDKDATHHINGGFCAFDNVNWDSCILGKQVVMSYLSGANNEGYPGNMLTQVKYSWTNDNELHINITATSTEPTPVNITNSCLFNLAGHGTGAKELKSHVVTINADKWTFMDIKDNLPTGVIQPVNCTIYDLRSPTQLNKDRLYRAPGGGYNHNLCITSPSCWCYRFHARILHPESGRFLELYSNQPGLQFYTGNNLPNPNLIYLHDLEEYCSIESDDYRISSKNSIEGIPETKLEMYYKDGVVYRRHGGFALSPQNYPNAVNVEGFPSCILYPGKIYTHNMTYKFGVLLKA